MFLVCGLCKNVILAIETSILYYMGNKNSYIVHENILQRGIKLAKRKKENKENNIFYLGS